jgi:hypothetical protein
LYYGNVLSYETPICIGLDFSGNSAPHLPL